MDSLSTDILVIGAGVIGLAVAEKLSKKYEVVLIEQFPQFGRETSSRNSEVVHSGIYYPQDSLKTKLCLSGRQQLYLFCEQTKVPFKKCGKFVVATHESEQAYLEKLYSHCISLNVPVEKVTDQKLMRAEQLVKASSALFFPETGIVDSHQLMQRLEEQALQNGANIVYRHTLKKLVRRQAWETTVSSPQGDVLIQSKRVINCAGLNASEITNAALETKRYAHRFCRGRYFSLSQKYQNRFQHLVYPVPPKDGLGVHVTIDTSGFARLGPDVDWCENTTYTEVNTLYDCDWESLREPFLNAVQRYCPSIQANEISPGLIGIRPKLFLEGKAYPDFLIETQEGFTHCLGIESPGLTASLAIADLVAQQIS